MKKNKLRFWLDLAMTVVLCLLYSPESTSLPFHEIAGLVLGGVLIIHVLLNKKWVINITKKIFSKDLKKKTRFSYLLNVILLIDMLFIMVSGLFISKVVLPNFRYFPNVNWMPIHIVSSILGLVIVGIHIGLHWNWIKQMGSHFPKLAKLFTFRKPSRKLMSRLILIIGTVCMLVQVPKAVSMTPAMFSNASENGFEKFKNEMNDKQTGQNQTNSDKDFKGHDESFSIIGLAGSVPNLVLYSSVLGSMAFYTYSVERRRKRKRTVSANLEG
ncbi:DUF4405 domain-containing protein [Neobacillus vireti]|uniref:DUF4405 domain-containing protein n=1 Tax=Neobacillus vireti TaxID=220686 RepID=UPI002FFEA1E4